jgi:pimeloyl-ACP methyl ester carboxylesterase
MSLPPFVPKPRGRLVDIGEGRHLHAVESGPPGATPLVILEAGAFGFSADWEAVQARLAAAGFRSLAYDRAGLGFSDPAREPRDAEAIAADLAGLLDALGETGPYIYCGHSMAGLHARLFAARHRDRLAGVVLADATSPEATQSGLLPRLVEAFALFCRAAAAGVALGLFRPFETLGLGNAIGVEGPAAAEKRWAFGDARHNHWAALEVRSWIASARQALVFGGFDADLPVSAVFAGNRGARAAPLAPEISPMRQVTRVPDATHASLLGPRHADAIVKAVEFVNDARPYAGAPERLAEPEMSVGAV